MTAIVEAASQEMTWVMVLGECTVRRNGRDLPSSEVGSRKARLLLAQLAVADGRPVIVEDLVAALWPARPPRHQAENVATLVSRLRSVLGPDAIVRHGNGYRLGRGIVVDLTAAAGLVGRAEAQQPAAALEAALCALNILDRGEVLPDQPVSELVERARRRHADLCRRARLAAAHAALRTGDIRLAHATASAAVRADPLDETAHRALMRANRTAGERGQALAVYERLRHTLTTELGADPSPQTQRLHLEILREQADVDAHGPPPPVRTEDRGRRTHP
jgi:DNA-binding SARP family transcriptional activator